MAPRRPGANRGAADAGLLDPRKLLYLATVIEQGSLAKAAKLLAVSQPALSKSMDRLEAESGAKLLERGAGGITPTAFGEALYAHARQIREEMSLAESRLRKGGRTAGRVVTMGTLPSLATSVVPLAVGRWRDEHQDVVLRVVEGVQVDLLLGLLRQQFDFVIGQTEFYDFWDGLKQRVLFRDRLRIVARTGHPLFDAGDFAWATLAGCPWVCPLVGGVHRTLLEKILQAEGLALPARLVECGSVDFTKALVAGSDHLAMLPGHSVSTEVSGGALRALPITLPALRRDIAVIFRDRTTLDGPSRALVAHVRTIGTELARENAGD